MRLLFFLVSMVFGHDAFAGGNRYPEGTFACLYYDENFSGDIHCLVITDGYTLRVTDKRAMSVKIVLSESLDRVTVFKDTYHRGDSWTLLSSTKILPNDWKRQIRSVKPGGDFWPYGAQACFFKQINYAGDRYCYTSGTPSLSDGIFKSSNSMKMTKPIVVFSEENYQGKSKIIKYNIPDLGGWKNAIASFKPWHDKSFVCLYNMENFNGRELCLSEDTKYLGGFDKETMSIKVSHPPVTIFQQQGFTGSSWTLYENHASLPDKGHWQRNVSSVKKGGSFWPKEALACFYQDLNYQGERFCYTKSTPWLSPGIYASSQSLKIKAPITVFDKGQYKGNSKYFIKNQPDLADWKNRIRSFKKGEHFPAKALACFYQSHYYLGERYCISKNTPTFEKFDDKARSAKVSQTVTVYKQPHYQGGSRIISESTPDLGQSWDDEISSVKKGMTDEFKICLFEFPEYRGRQKCFSNNLLELGSEGFNGSVKIYNSHQHDPDDDGDGDFISVIFYTGPYHTGEAHEYKSDHANMTQKLQTKSPTGFRQKTSTEGFKSVLIKNDTKCD